MAFSITASDVDGYIACHVEQVGCSESSPLVLAFITALREATVDHAEVIRVLIAFGWDESLRPDALMPLLQANLDMETIALHMVLDAGAAVTYASDDCDTVLRNISRTGRHHPQSIEILIVAAADHCSKIAV